MACCGKRGYVCALVTLGMLAVAFHGFAFVAPGWIMLEKELTKAEITSLVKTDIEIQEDIIKVDRPPQATGGPVALSKRQAEAPTTTVVPALEIREEMRDVQEWIVTVSVSISVSISRTRSKFSLFLSCTFCL